MLPSARNPVDSPIAGEGPLTHFPATGDFPRKTDAKRVTRTTFRTIIRTWRGAPGRTGGPANSKGGPPTMVTHATFDLTSFYPQASATSQSGSGASNNPTSREDGVIPSSTSDSAIPPNPELDNSSVLLAILLSIFGAVIVLLAIGSYIAWRLHKKRKAKRRAQNAETSATGVDNSYDDEPPSRARQHSVVKRLSEMFFAPSSRATSDHPMPRIRGEFNVPADVPRQGGRPPHIRMRDLPPIESHELPEPVDTEPSSQYVSTYQVGGKRYKPGQHQTTTTIGSLLNYYQDSGKQAGPHEYERLSSESHTASQSAYETVYQDSLAEGFGPAHGKEDKPMGDITQPVEESVLQARLEALAKIEGRPLPKKRGRVVDRNEQGDVITQDPVTPVDRGYGDLEDKSRSWETAPPHNDSKRDFSTSGLRPSPLCIRKVGATPPLPSSSPNNSPRMLDKRTGYEEYMDNPYRVEVRGDDNFSALEEPMTSHIEGSYELWAKQQREERRQRAAGSPVNRSDHSSINHTRGESSGSQRSPLRQLAERTEGNITPQMSPRKGVHTQGKRYDRHTDATDEYEDSDVAVAQNQAQQSQNPNRLEWYRVIRDRLRTQTPALSRQSQLDQGSEASGVDSHKGKGVVGRDLDDRYTYASTAVSEDVFLPRAKALRTGIISPRSPGQVEPGEPSAGRVHPQPITTEDNSAGAHQDMVVAPSDKRASRLGLRKKTSAGLKRLSGRFHKKW